MFDTIRLYQKGENERNFKIYPSQFKKQMNEFDKIDCYRNIFKVPVSKASVFVEYDSIIKQGVNITFSIPKVAGINLLSNFHLSDKSKLINNLSETLKEVIDIDFENMDVSRLDVSSNLETESDVKHYINCLISSYVAQKNYKSLLFENESFTIYNKSRRIVCYDKITEQLKSGTPIPKEQREKKNIFRFEIQNKRGRDTKQFYGRGFKFNELFTESVFLDSISNQKKYFKNLFMNNKEQLNLFETDKKLIDRLMGKGKRGLVQRFFLKKYLDSDSFNFYDIDLYFNTIYSKRTIRRITKEFRELKFLAVNSEYDLLSELYGKFDGLQKLVA